MHTACPRRFSHVAHYKTTVLTFWVARSSGRVLQVVGVTAQPRDFSGQTNRAFYFILFLRLRVFLSSLSEETLLAFWLPLRGFWDVHPSRPTSIINMYVFSLSFVASTYLRPFFGREGAWPSFSSFSFPFSICWAGYIYFLIYIVSGGFLFYSTTYYESYVDTSS